jgi:tetratricopeptide (TPR) repeat protein
MSFNRALLLYEQSRYDLAEKELRRQLAHKPEDVQAHALLALSLSEQDKAQEALQEAELAVHLGPDFAWAHYVLARVLHQQDQDKAAERAVNEALRLEPEAVNHWSLLSAIHIDRHDWAAALEAAERGLSFDPEHVGCANLRAMALIKLGRKQESDLAVGAALARDPENAVTHANQGWILLEAGDHQRAMEHFRQALRLEPTMDWARSGIVAAMKARNIVYRYLLQYFFWISRLDRRVQWGVIFGGFIAFRLIQGVARATPDIAPLAWVLIAAYLAFVYLTWSADTLFNLLLRLDRFGRLALSRNEMIASNLAGSTLLVGLLGLGWWAVAGSASGLSLALWGVIMVIPIGGAFRRAGSGRLILIAFTVILALLGLVGVFIPASQIAFFLGILIYTIVANIIAARN